MTLTFLGKGSAFYPAYGNTGAYFLKENTLYLIDCGESTFAVLQKKGILEGIDQVYALITHLHADHVGSLASLISYLYYEKNIRAAVIHPEQTILSLLDLEGIEAAAYQWHQVMPENTAGIEIIPVPVQHVETMSCYGYLLADQSEQLYYSGDASDIPKEILTAFLNGQIDRIYQDTAAHDSDHPSHCYYKKLEALIPVEFRNKVFCMHLDSPCEELLIACGFQIVEVVED